MAFRFNFPNPEDEIAKCDENNFPNTAETVMECDNSKLFFETHQAVEVAGSTFPICKCSSSSLNEVGHAKEVKFGNIDVKYTSLKSVKKKTENPNLLLTDSLGTDLLPGVYEGGFKVWECAFDLANYLVVNNCIKANDAVLELGCGAGLPGIVAYICGASVAFQDLNSEVLEYVTIPNIMLNTSEDKYAHVKQKCAFLSGDWECIRKCFYSYAQETNLFDIILSSETIYEKGNQVKLLNLMKAALKKEGIIFIAAKIHYFGVSGGILDFEKLVEEDGTFTISTVERFTNGFERRIVKMKRKKTS